MKIVATLLAICLIIAIPVFADAGKEVSYAGSVSCRECHEKFYKLWSTSMHGLAMQPYTAVFAKAKLTPQQKDVITQQDQVPS